MRNIVTLPYNKLVMYLKRLSASNFKNLKEIRLEFSPKINCISGRNGSGKTNLLDAVYYLSVTKSFFSSGDSAVISHNRDESALHGEYLREDGTGENISVGISRNGEKSIKRNAKSYQRLSDHVGLIPVVMVSPSDSALINDSGEERRRFLNSILSQVDKEYLRRLQKYNHLLSARNRLLKSSDISFDVIEAVSLQMSDLAKYINIRRAEFCSSLEPVSARYYEKISGGREEISIKYRSDLSERDLLSLFEENFERDRMLHYTTCGIQRDDMLFELEGWPIRKFGSQGQQKSFLLALKMAQFEIMQKIYGKAPLLLLDDVFDKLDMQRVQYLLHLVAQDGFGQIFITDSNKVRLDSLLNEVGGESISIEIDGGEVCL